MICPASSTHWTKTFAIEICQAPYFLLDLLWQKFSKSSRGWNPKIFHECPANTIAFTTHDCAHQWAHKHQMSPFLIPESCISVWECSRDFEETCRSRCHHQNWIGIQDHHPNNCLPLSLHWCRYQKNHAWMEEKYVTGNAFQAVLKYCPFVDPSSLQCNRYIQCGFWSDTFALCGCYDELWCHKILPHWFYPEIALSLQASKVIKWEKLIVCRELVWLVWRFIIIQNKWHDAGLILLWVGLRET